MTQIELPTELGAPFQGGYYAGRFQLEGQPYALIVAPKSQGEREPGPWNRSYKDVGGAKSWNDGLQNTRAMAEAGSALAKWALGLDIDKYTDWYLPSVDELELCYRAFKPDGTKNSSWARSGINPSALPPTYPYTAGAPTRTPLAAFEAGGTEAFEVEPYWTSTQHAAVSDSAWTQTFDYGNQDFWYKDDKLRARAVRRIALI